MRQQSYLIGRLIRLYCEGRAHARVGHKRHRAKGESVDDRAMYLLGHADETARMADEARLKQVELFDAAEVK